MMNIDKANGRTTILAFPSLRKYALHARAGEKRASSTGRIFIRAASMRQTGGVGEKAHSYQLLGFASTLPGTRLALFLPPEFGPINTPHHLRT